MRLQAFFVFILEGGAVSGVFFFPDFLFLGPFSAEPPFFEALDICLDVDRCLIQLLFRSVL